MSEIPSTTTTSPPSPTPPRILSLLLRPLVRFALRNSLTYREFSSVAKRVFILLAETELKKQGEKVSASRISAMTGLPRYDITQIQESGAEIPDQPISVVARVLVQWEQDRRFTTSSGIARVLSCDGVESEFYQLVRTVSTHVNPLSILFELQRNGSVIKTKRGAKMIRQTFVKGEDVLEGYELLSRDIGSLVQAAEENIQTDYSPGNLHHRTTYDNVFQLYIPRIRAWLLEEGRAFHRRARDFIGQFDKDINPEAAPPGTPAGGVVVLGSFSTTSRPAPSAPLPLPEITQASLAEKPWQVFSF